jgi:Protein of unknown function (DUF2491)
MPFRGFTFPGAPGARPTSGVVANRRAGQLRDGSHSQQVRPLPKRRHIASLLGLLLTAEAAALPLALGLATEAWAQSRSSGGYSRPSTSYSRTPSFGSSRSVPRTPSTGGGYARSAPSTRPSTSLPWSSGSSAGDQAFSRQRAAEALNAYRARQRAQQEAARRTAPPQGAGPATSIPYGGMFGGGSAAPPSYGGRVVNRQRSDWYTQRGWTPPPFGYNTAPSRGFGLWDGLFLWALLSNLSRPGSLDFFRNHQDDPGYRQWRQEANTQARDNPELRQRLDELDRQLAQQTAQPRDPNYLPPDVPPEIALAPDAKVRTPGVADSSGGGGLSWLPVAVLAGGGVLVWLVWQRRRQSGPPGATAMNPLQTAGAMLRHKLSGEAYTPDKFRVGMTMGFDPTPFLLAGDATKVAAPAPDAGSTRLSIDEVGQLSGQGVSLTRLYLPERRGYFQLHLDSAGNPDECRYFTPIDAITPADPNEWGAWLDPNEGMIGWPQFQTKDGKLYDRVWASGSGPTPPVRLEESAETVQGPRTGRLQSMLYAAPTGLASPAPSTEYILVSAIEEPGRAWVEVAAGIDVNPAMLALA